uniref:Potassium/proton antiporter CemA n=1 Tax=Koshicola spirodelophila TaxID=1707787 RepID=A0A160E7T7_9CHLO|nr:chloroplast envelope membrane protein [Koshicola spirodelophila]
MELERIGFIPRSILRMLDRFYHQLSVGTAEPLVKQFRFSKYLLLTSVKSLLILIFVPLFTNFLTKTYIFRPLIEYYWDGKQSEIFLNVELQERAFYEIHNFEEKMYFESLVKHNNKNSFFGENPNSFDSPLSGGKQESVWGSLPPTNSFSQREVLKESEAPIPLSVPLLNISNEPLISDQNNKILESKDSGAIALLPNAISHKGDELPVENFMQIPLIKEVQHRLQEKTLELAEHYNHESQEAITNLLADFMGLITLCFLLINMKMSIMNTTAFLFESFFSLKDSKKSFIMLLFTDLLVGFHSPRGWEVIFHSLFEHFGLPENHNIILLLVGTFPVLLDALFKYWIFRHLNRHSPATVATYQSMVE